MSEIREIVSRVCAAISGYTSPGELVWLAEQARAVPPDLEVVEVGVWLGRSLAVLDLARETRAAVGVDHFGGNPELARLVDSPYALELRCRANLKLVGAEPDLVTLPSRRAARLFSSGSAKVGARRIGMLFLDADHAYEAVWTDLLHWAPRMAPGSLLVVHDYYLPRDNPEAGFPGVKQAVDEWAHEFDPVPNLPLEQEWSIWAGVKR